MRAVLWLEALRGPRPSRVPALLVLATALVLCGGVFALRAVDNRPEDAVLVLLCVPVAFVALSFGRWGGLAAAAAATGAVAAWQELFGHDTTAVGYASRVTAYLLLGLPLGWMADRLVAAERARQRDAARTATARYDLEEAQRLAEIGSWRWDRATDRLEWSPEMFRIFALDRESDEATFTAAVAARSHPDDAARAVAARDTALRDGRPFEFEQRLVLPDRSERHVLNRGEVLRGADGAIVAMRGTTQDVTRLWEAERAARAAGERLSAVLETMLDAVTVGTAVRDGTGRIVDFRLDYANPSALALYGQPAERLLGRRWSEVWPERMGSPLFDAYVGLVETGDPVTLVNQPFQLGDATVLTDSRIARLGDGYVVAWRDVTARQRDAEAIAAAAARFTAAFDSAPAGMALLDRRRRLVRVNPALAIITGHRLEELVNATVDEVTDPRDLPALREDLDRLSAAGTGFRREARLTTVDGSARWVTLSAAAVGVPGGDCAIVHVEDIHERKSFEGRLQYLADHDPLTGLFNRRRFHEELGHQLTLDARYGRTSMVLLVDLDNFKYINDTLGHQTGDRLIQAIARSLRARLRTSDIVGRLGGDEFGVVLPGADEGDAVAVATSLLAGISASEVERAGQRVRSTGSAGIARLDAAQVRDPDDVLANADLAMYAAKEAGRNTFVVYDPHGPHAARSRARFRWLDRVRHALDHELFTLHAQPILDLGTGQISGCELLLRMEEDGRLVTPDRFLYIAERHGLANAIDRFVIRRAVDLAAGFGSPPGFRWEVNLSADSLADPGIPDLIADRLAATGLPAASLVFEITETAAITNMDAARAFADRITDIGCRFALDDFGAGYGSFYYLKHLPFEYLKIDGEFIRQLTTSETDRVIVQAIVAAARPLGKQTIAEYVGDQATLDLLRTFHVDHAQGYHVGRPAAPRISPDSDGTSAGAASR